MFNKSKLKKVVKNVRGKRGTVRRTYYVKSEVPQKKGFLRRHAGKLLAGAALAGLAYANRHKLAGAARGASLALNAHKHSGSNATMSTRAKDAFRMAKIGFANNRGMDIADGSLHRARMAFAGTAGHRLRGQRALASGQNALRNARANMPQTLNNARAKATEWRRSTGADLAHHMATQGGDVVASHVGSRFGQVAGTAVGGLMGGPGGAAVGAWAGQTAGAFLGSRHAAPHIARGAEWLANRMRR